MDNAFHGQAHTAVQIGHVQGHVHVHNTPSAEVPRQLPAPRLLVDRHESTAWLERSWNLRQGPLWTAVEGPSGIGKTALAASWEAARRDRWVHGALYIQDPGRRTQELEQALALYEHLAHPDAERLREQLAQGR